MIKYNATVTIPGNREGVTSTERRYTGQMRWYGSDEIKLQQLVVVTCLNNQGLRSYQEYVWENVPHVIPEPPKT